MRIQLDTQAMEALFPEGSEARVELQQAVLQNIIDRNFLKMPVDHVAKACAEAAKAIKLPDVRAMAEAEMQKLTTRTGWNGPAKATPAFAVHIREAAENEVQTAVNLAVSNAIAQIDKAINERVEQHLGYFAAKVKNLIEEKLDTTAAQALNARFDEVLKLAIAQKFNLK